MLQTRVLSALVLAPPALLAAWWGDVAFAVLAAVAAAIMCWEWSTIVAKEFSIVQRLGAVLLAAAPLTLLVAPAVAVALVLVAAAVAGLAGGVHRTWLAGGVLYAGVPALALVWLRGDYAVGRETVFWLLLLVWATDIGAYASGRLIGGPKLLRAVSPNKTWAGLIGGMICAAAVGWGMALVLGSANPPMVGLGSGALAVVAQAGDLFESWIKRRFGVKDSSAIIPGHGGVLDRVDGLLAAAVAVAVATLASGVPVLLW
ncbi:MAG: phosphatidate cytidylyltransferase [Magnetospirillum sp.]|nr:phosphatidate cytidylyltransferase [Magnetospirillum sp.]